MLGAPEGLFDGLDVGSAVVGARLGALLGPDEGLEVGSAVVGLVLGLDVGFAVVGEEVGLSEGCRKFDKRKSYVCEQTDVNPRTA